MCPASLDAEVEERKLCLAPSSSALFTFQSWEGCYHLVYHNNHQLPLPLLPFGSWVRAQVLRNSKVTL